MPKTHQSKLSALFPGQALLSDDISRKYSVDWSAENACMPDIVIKAKSVKDVSKLLAYCDSEKLPLVTQGGMTGLSGGATPQAGEIVLSMEALTGITEIDPDSMTISVLAGTPLERVQQAVRDAGFYLPLDLGARGSCTIGGNVSTNAGGTQVLSYGMTRALVLGLEAVTADGTIIRSMNKMLKNNAGYDLKQLFIGSEGTLGVVTEVVLRMLPLANCKFSALCAFKNFSDVVVFLRAMQSDLSRVTAFELMWSNYIEQVLFMNPSCVDPFPEKHPLYVLIEAEGSNVQRDGEQFEQALSHQMEQGGLIDAVVAQNNTQANQFWKIRDGVTAILAQVPELANFDIGLPVSQMEVFVERVEEALVSAFDNLTLCTFGHMADGNLHIFAWTGVAGDVEKIYQYVYRAVGEYGGTITAEHGVGAMKRKYLPHCRTNEELALMRTLKQAMDPNGILNARRVI